MIHPAADTERLESWHQVTAPAELLGDGGQQGRNEADEKRCGKDIDREIPTTEHDELVELQSNDSGDAEDHRIEEQRGRVPAAVGPDTRLQTCVAPPIATTQAEHGSGDDRRQEPDELPHTRFVVDSSRGVEDSTDPTGRQRDHREQDSVSYELSSSGH